MNLKKKIGLNSLSKSLIELFSGEEKRSSFIGKTYGAGEDNFTEVNERLQKNISEGNATVKRAERKIAPKFNYPVTLTKSQSEIVNKRGRRRQAGKYSANAYAEVFKEFPKFQVTISNSSVGEKEIVLWGANQEISVSAPAPEDVQDQVIAQQLALPTGVSPQAALFNPVNNFIYVANQLSGTVSVFDSSNQFVTEIQLKPTTIGACSPVALAVNNNPSSVQYGYVYVACSISNELSVIDLFLQLVNHYPVGTRPLSVAYNFINNAIYVSDYIDNTITVLDGDTNLPRPGSPLTTGSNPIGLAVNPINGDVFVANSASNDVYVFDKNNTIQGIIGGLGNHPVSLTYSPATTRMYVACSVANCVWSINSTTYTAVQNISTGIEPWNTFYDSANHFIYVQNRASSTITVIDPTDTVYATLNLGTQNIGGAYNSYNGSIYVTDTVYNRVNVISYLPISSSISVSDDYNELRRDFQSNPCQVQHARFVMSGPERINHFRHNRFLPTGSAKSRAISFEQFASPQHGMNVSEAIVLSGSLIDGKMNWSFKLPGRSTLSILVWFRQFLVKDLLSTGTQNPNPTI
jgi:YVTN family beta-propeller protein